MFGMPVEVKHAAIAFPDRGSRLRQLAYHQEKGVAFDRLVDHGMT